MQVYELDGDPDRSREASSGLRSFLDPSMIYQYNDTTAQPMQPSPRPVRAQVDDGRVPGLSPLPPASSLDEMGSSITITQSGPPPSTRAGTEPQTDAPPSTSPKKLRKRLLAILLTFGVFSFYGTAITVNTTTSPSMMYSLFLLSLGRVIGFLLVLVIMKFTGSVPDTMPVSW